LAKPKEIVLEIVENGKFVSVEYTGTLENGEVFDTSVGRQPLEIHMGAGEMIPGFEAQLMGMAINGKKEFTLTPEEAYGQVNEALMQFVPRSEAPPDMDVKIGMVVGFITPDGHRVPARVVEIDDTQFKMDLNHPLAGKSLTFAIEVVGISDTPTQESCGDSCDCHSECDCSGDCCD
jgi:peptidylprolyl isomerase